VFTQSTLTHIFKQDNRKKEVIGLTFAVQIITENSDCLAQINFSENILSSNLKGSLYVATGLEKPT
jgi:hypothetical protein